MNLLVEPGVDALDDGVFRRRVSVTRTGAQSANCVCHPGDRSLHISMTSGDGAVCAVVITLDAACQLAMTLGGGAASTVAAPTAAAHDTPPSAYGTRPGPTRHRLHLGHFHRNAPIWHTPAEPRR